MKWFHGHDRWQENIPAFQQKGGAGKINLCVIITGHAAVDGDVRGVVRDMLCELAQSPFLPFGLHFDVGRTARTEVLGGDRSIDAGSSTSDCDEDSNGRESHGSRELRG